MTVDIAVVGAGPAGLEVVERILDEMPAAHVWWIERQQRPDGLLRHGPSAGVDRLRAVAARVDQVLARSEVTFIGGVEVVDTTDGRGEGPADLGRGIFPTRGLALFRPARISFEELRSAVSAVVIATGAPTDRPLDVAGDDSVGIGTVSHVHAWLAGSPDTSPDELDIDVDSAVVIGESPASRAVVDLLTSRSAPEDAPAPVRERLSSAAITNVTVIPADGRAVGVVGRNRARALRIMSDPDRDGLVRVADVRAQLLLRPVAEPYLVGGLAGEGSRYAQVAGRSPSAVGVYVAGWAGRDPGLDLRSHADDARAVGASLSADLAMLDAPVKTPGEVLPEPVDLRWTATAATEELIDRFAGEGTLPLADYEDLLEQVDED